MSDVLYPSPIVTVANRPGYRIGLEQRDGLTFCHCEVTAPFTRALWHRLQHDANTIFNLHGGPLVTASLHPHNDDLAKHAKFVAMLGFKFVTMLSTPDGHQLACYARTE